MTTTTNKINHAERDHALLSPSASARWIKCTMSVPLNEQYPDTTSEFAEEGTTAHEVAEYEVEKLFGITRTEEAPVPLDEDMARHAVDYANYIHELTTSADDTILVEQKVKLFATMDQTALSTLCFGTADCLLLTDDETSLHVVDYKYGKGVEVSAVMNPQLMLYAIMALSTIGKARQVNVENIHLHIYQPRIGNISTWSLTKRELMDFYIDAVAVAIQSILNEDYYMQAGDHCRWCKHRPSCKMYKMTYFDKVLAEMRMEANSLTKAEIGAVLKVKDDLVKWLTDLQDKVTNDILAGEVYDGFRVVEGRSVRQIVDKEGATLYLRSQGYKEQEIFKPLELQNITALTKLMGKKTFDTEMAKFITKPQGKPTLVPADDKRPDFVDEAKSLEAFND